MIRAVLKFFAILAICAGAAGESAQDALDRRADEVAAMIGADPSVPAGLFHPSFTAQVPDAQMAAINRQIFAMCGAVREVTPTGRSAPTAGTYDFVTEKGFSMPVTLEITADDPPLISGLFFGAPVPLAKNLEAIVESLKALPGSVSFGAWCVSGAQPSPLAVLNPDQPLAIGSAFKLYILGTLVDDVNEGTRRAEDTVVLTESVRSLPSGEMQDWPEGSPVTLSTAANMMISKSDNTATDLLLSTVGRERVESMLPTMGMTAPARCRPFLSTGEMFKLKYVDEGRAATEYLALDEAGRREFLGSSVARISLDGFTPSGQQMTRPSHIDTLEWFASAADLCRAMVWLEEHTRQHTILRGALSINRGLAISERDFPWVGFKGGSEPGVINLTYLLERADGMRFVVAAIWNDPAAPVDETKFAGLMLRAIALLGECPPATE